MPSATTRGIQISVDSAYLDAHSQPERREWVFGYTVDIQNIGDSTVQLIDRHWVITDAHGRVEHVRGQGVVGRQPKILPGGAFRYTSFCPLGTSMGSMTGEYTFKGEDGSLFEATIPPFALIDPESEN